LLDVNPSLGLKYFLLQEFFTVVGLFCLGCLAEWFLFTLCLLLKLAFPPFHGWFLKILFLVDEDGWLLGLSKLVAVV
jgi:hypothetical protein